MRKKGVALILVLMFALLAAAGCGGQQSADQGGDKAAPAEKYTIKVADWYAPDHPQNVALGKFKEIVEEKTDGNITVEIYDNNKLGSEDVFIDSVKNGTVEMGVPGTMISKDIPAVSVCEMPFLFRDWDHAHDVLMGPIGDEITKDFVEKAGFRSLAITVNGFREITANKPLNSMADFQGMRLRVPNVPYYIEMAKGLGASPVSLAFSELFTSLEQNVVDGQENPYATIRSSSFYEVQKYALETRHMFSPNFWIINEKFFQSLPAEYQQIVTDAAKEAADYNWQLSQEADEADKKILEDNGMTIVVPDAAFRQELVDSQTAARQYFYDNFGVKELAEKIMAQ